jgi:hypothetical protein
MARPARSGVSGLSMAQVKNISVAFLFESRYKRVILSHTEGRIAIVMKRGMRCGGRGSVRRAVGRRAGGGMPSVSEYLA